MIGGRSAAFARGALTHSLLLPLAHKVRFRVLQHIVRPIAQHRLGEVAQDGLELLRYFGETVVSIAARSPEALCLWNDATFPLQEQSAATQPLFRKLLLLYQ